MKKYIVPTKAKVQQWRNFFEGTFKDEEHQDALMSTLITLVVWLSFAAKGNPSTAVELIEQTFDFATELAETGQTDVNEVEAVAQVAYEMATSLASYLKSVGVLQVPKIIKFEGFVGMDILIKVLEPGEVDEPEERSCRSG